MINFKKTDRKLVKLEDIRLKNNLNSNFTNLPKTMSFYTLPFNLALRVMKIQ